jgi:hypothetical protein
MFYSPDLEEEPALLSLALSLSSTLDSDDMSYAIWPTECVLLYLLLSKEHVEQWHAKSSTIYWAYKPPIHDLKPVAN